MEEEITTKAPENEAVYSMGLRQREMVFDLIM
jgi:hypothetical protein